MNHLQVEQILLIKLGVNKMKIPKYIDRLIERRKNLAWELIEVSTKLDNWLEKLNIPMDNDCTSTGAMIYCEPDEAALRVRNDILNKEE